MKDTPYLKIPYLNKFFFIHIRNLLHERIPHTPHTELKTKTKKLKLFLLPERVLLIEIHSSTEKPYTPATPNLCRSCTFIHFIH